MQQVHAQVKKKWASIFSLCSGQSGNLWTVTTSKYTVISPFYSARNIARIHKIIRGSQFYHACKKIKTQQVWPVVIQLQGFRHCKPWINKNVIKHQNEGFTAQSRGMQKENKKAFNLQYLKYPTTVKLLQAGFAVMKTTKNRIYTYTRASQIKYVFTGFVKLWTICQGVRSSSL